jgi:hypothetical protein
LSSYVMVFPHASRAKYLSGATECCNVGIGESDAVVGVPQEVLPTA